MTIEVKILLPNDEQTRAGRKRYSGLATDNQDQFPVIAHDIDTNSGAQAMPKQDSQDRVLESKDLFKGGNEILIRHEGAVYRMKITRQGKLILNK